MTFSAALTVKVQCVSFHSLCKWLCVNKDVMGQYTFSCSKHAMCLQEQVGLCKCHVLLPVFSSQPSEYFLFHQRESQHQPPEDTPCPRSQQDPGLLLGMNHHCFHSESNSDMG